MNILEKTANLCHEQWIGWMKYLFGKCIKINGDLLIPAESVKRWKRQIDTAYSALPEIEKESDRVEARKFILLLSDHVRRRTKNTIPTIETEIILAKEALSIIEEGKKFTSSVLSSAIATPSTRQIALDLSMQQDKISNEITLLIERLEDIAHDNHRENI